MWDINTTHATWTARYEALRSGWIDHEIGWGQALFLRQGMAAWMKGWLSSTHANLDPPADNSTSECESSTTIGGATQRHLTRVLANLILQHQQEVLS